MIIALAGGVGGARLAHGLALNLPPGELIIVVNTGDDFTHLGLHVSPDPDTVLYTLAGLADPERGWGQRDETFHAMAALGRLGGENWFALGDKDLATHIERTRRLAAGETLSAITADFAVRLGVANMILPMSDDAVRTIVHTDAGALAFQDYFVRQRCAPQLRHLEFAGAAAAVPNPAFMAALADDRLRGIIIGPSNPFLSIDPILAIPGIRPALAQRRVPCVAISPLIGGKAVRGPAAKIMAELNLAATPRAIATHYAGLIDGLIIDHADAPAAYGPCHATSTLMRGTEGRAQLGLAALNYLKQLSLA